MQIINKKTSELIPYEKNGKIHTQKQIKQVADSIKAFGFKQPIVIDKDNIVIVGHGRLEASKLLKLDQVPCLIAEDLTDDQIKAYRLADNKLNESDWDMELVIEEIEILSDDLVRLTGFDNSIYLDDDFSEKNKEIDVDSLGDDLNAECPQCGFTFKS